LNYAVNLDRTLGLNADHQRLLHLINHVLRAIELRVFYRNTGWQCGDCQFKKTCFS
jgi:hypothetical protein